MFIKKIAIDLGTANTLVYLAKKEIVVNEPSVVVISTDDNQILAVGNEAKEIVGRTPEAVVASRPLQNGVIADYRATEAMLRYFINKASGRIRFLRPEIMVAVSVGITSTERRAVIEATMKAGAKAVYLISQPVAAAIGAGIPISEPSGNMIVDIGAGTSEVAVVSLGGIVASASARVGGDKIDQAIIEFVRKNHGLAIGQGTAEEIKIILASAFQQSKEENIEVRGRDLMTGLPKTITIGANEICQAIQNELIEIIQVIRSVFQKTPPEISADIIDKGIILSGGGGLLHNLDGLITKVIGVPCYLAEQPMECVVRGTGVALENLDAYKRSILSIK